MSRVTITLRWLTAAAALVVSAHASHAQPVFGGNGIIETTGTGGIPGLECVWVSCAGAGILNPQGTGLDGCFWDGQDVAGNCMGRCSYCSGDGTTTWLCRPSANHTCDPYGSTSTSTCGVIYTNPCYFSADSPFPKNMCMCNASNGEVTTSPCIVSRCQ